jgi:hypothetical protein
MSSFTTPATRVKSGGPGSAAPDSRRLGQILRDSEMNRRSHAIRDAARRLIDLMDELDDSNAEGDLLLELRDAGYGCRDFPEALDRVRGAVDGFRWTLSQFLGVLESSILPPEDEAEDRAGETARVEFSQDDDDEADEADEAPAAVVVVEGGAA